MLLQPMSSLQETMERTKSVLMDVDQNYYDMKDILACKQSLRCLFYGPLPQGDLFLKFLAQMLQSC